MHVDFEIEANNLNDKELKKFIRTVKKVALFIIQ